MYRNIILATLVLIIAPTVLAQGTVDGNPDLALIPEDNTFAPGETGRLTFSILNDGEIDDPGLANLEAQTMIASGLTYTVGDRGNASINLKDNVIPVGDVPDGLFPQKMGFRVHVWDNASSGNYYVPVNLSYRFKDSITYDTSSGTPTGYDYDEEFINKKIALRVKETANLKLVDSSFSGSVGDTGILSLEVENTGNATVEDTSFSLQSRNQDLTFGRAASTEKYIGTWEGGETKNLDFRASVAPDAVKSEMTVQASANFQNDGFPEQDSFSFGLQADSENKVALENIQANLTKGSENTVTGEVVNNAGRDLSDFEVVFNPDDPRLTVKQSSYAVGTLENGERASFSFPVEVSSGAEPGPRIYGLTTVYESADGSSQTRTQLNFNAEVVDSEGDFIVEPVNTTVVQGGSTVYTVNVTNPSSSTYENVDAKIYSSDPISTEDDRAFASSIESGSTEQMSFELSAGSSALTKSYPVRMDFRYEVGDESKYSDTYRTPVTVEEEESSGTPVMPIVAVLLVALAGASYYFRKPEALWNRSKDTE